MTDGKTYLVTEEAAEYLRSSVSTLARWRTLGTGPEYVKRQGRVLYRLDRLEAYLDANTRNATRDWLDVSK